MTKNKLSDLNNHLFAQLERLGEEDLSAEELEQEIGRSKAMVGVADKIINNGRLVLDAQIAAAEYNGKRTINVGLLNG